VCRYVLPRVGHSVKTMVMECSKAVTNGLVRQRQTDVYKSVYPVGKIAEKAVCRSV